MIIVSVTTKVKKIKMIIVSVTTQCGHADNNYFNFFFTFFFFGGGGGGAGGVFFQFFIFGIFSFSSGYYSMCLTSYGNR